MNVVIILLMYMGKNNQWPFNIQFLNDCNTKEENAVNTLHLKASQQFQGAV